MPGGWYYYLMIYTLFRSLTAFSLVAIMVVAGVACNPLQGDVKVYSGSKGGEQQTTPPPTPPLTQSPAQPNNPTERQITITAANSVFSIGMPAGYTEERKVNAQKPIDFWFEYLPSDNVSLEINGVAVQIPARRGGSRLGYTSKVTSFNYRIKNLTSQAISYNLHMEPSTAGDSIPAVTMEKWTAP
jgi:hypothetical protein